MVILPAIARLLPSHTNLSLRENLPLELTKNAVFALLYVPVPIYILSASNSIPPIEPSLATIVPSTLKSEPSQDSPELPLPDKKKSPEAEI